MRSILVRFILIVAFLSSALTNATNVSGFQEAHWNLGLGVGPNFTQLDAVKDDLKSSFGAAAWLSREWGERSRLDLSLDYFDFGGAGRSYPALSAGYGWRFFQDSRLKPFALVGAGLGVANSFPRSADAHQTAPHFFARAGLKELLAGKQWSIGLIYDFFYVKLDGKEATSAQLGLPMVTFSWQLDDAPAAAAKPEPVVRKSVDSDGDGVVDEKDECPNTPPGSKVNSIGCQPKQKVTKTLNVEFDTNRTTVREEYFPIIDAFGKFMIENPEIDVVIEGHTDSTGRHDRNMTLSAGRAESVKNSIVTRTGVDAKRLKSVGYGPDKPIASNKDADGRRRNRRVVAVVESK